LTPTDQPSAACGMAKRAACAAVARVAVDLGSSLEGMDRAGTAADQVSVAGQPRTTQDRALSMVYAAHLNVAVADPALLLDVVFDVVRLPWLFPAAARSWS
jgi:hypothetical protein